MSVDIRKILLPRSCAFCEKAAIGGSLNICPSCYLELPWLKKVCKLCAKPLFLDLQLCVSCSSKKRKKVDLMLVPFSYSTVVRKYILSMKYSQNLAFASLLSELLVIKILNYYHNLKLPDVLIPMPSHKKRICERGFNQAIFIAEVLQERLKIRVDKYKCIKEKNTQKQSGGMLERYLNVKNIFKVEAEYNNKAVAIIDDVVTTGNTVYSLAKELYKKGAKEVVVFALAKAYSI